jgi:transglutaminase-like putative cysteine protease
MRKSLLSPLRGIALAACLLLALRAGAVEVRDAPAFSVPARELQAAAAAVKREQATDVVVLLDERSYTFDEQHRVTVISRMIYRVDSPAGVENWAASSASWQPWYQAKPAIRARVVTTDGREHLLDQNLLRDAASRRGDNQVYDDTHVTEGPLPAIEVGAVIEEEITIRDEKPFFAAGSVYREYVGRPVPVLHTRVIIDAPEALPVKRATRLLGNATARETRANGRVRWVMDQGFIDAQEAMESNLPSDQPSWASVEFSTGASWAAVAAHYRELTEPRIRPQDARPLLGGLRLDRSASHEYIAKIVARLHREVRYTGVEFGEARLIPELPAETLRRKFGDCKDKSTLLVAALRASGIEAYLALLSAGGGQDVMPDLPGLGMFDHAIVYVPATAPGAEDLWIDATTEYARVGTLPPADTDRLALVIRPGEDRLIRTPALKSADNVQIETREFHLSEYGPSRVVETTETRGIVELEYRGWYAGADTQERLNSLNEYAQTTYRAKGLARYTHTASSDFTRHYSMTLDIHDAPVGSTDLNTAAVGVSLGNIATRLPAYFTEKLEDGSSSASRRADVVFDPYVVEWRYRVHAPDGFRSRELPANGTLQLGPARLTAEFSQSGGVVQANWRFDTVKGRYTPAEADAFLNAVRELKRRDVLLLAFDHQGVALRADGDFKGSLAIYRALVNKHPTRGVHRLRHAYALLEAGFGTRAQLEAQAATQLEPRYAFAWKVYGWMLQHDAVGRRFGAGFDRDAAIAAYRKARELDPQDTDIAADLGVLLEHDERGERYADKASLQLAVAEYQARAKLMGETQKADRYTDNLYYSLLYLGRFGEARDGLRREPPTHTRRALTLAAIAGADGSAKAIEAARDIAGSETERRTALKSAGGILTNLRAYDAAADLLEASARGQSTTAADTQRVALLRKVKAAERGAVAITDPRGVVLRTYSLLLSSDDKAAEFRALASRHSRDNADVDADYDAARRVMYSALTRQDTPFDVAADLVYGNLRVSVEGSDQRGYRAQLRGSGMAVNYYVVREQGEYKLLAVSPMVGSLARAALERLDAGDTDGARQWLDWARLEQRVTNSEDPLMGQSLSKFWTVGEPAEAADMRSAAAMLLADSQMATSALPLLLQARAAARGDEEALALDLALARSYQELEQWTELEEVGARLSAAWPGSGLAFHYQQWARIQQKRWDEVAAAAKSRLARLPDDATATRVLVESADARGAHAEMLKLMEPVVASGRATAAEFNEYAWIALLQRPLGERAVEMARQAYDETQGRESAVAHTLACVYAATGKPREARDLLVKGLDRLGTFDEVDDASWFGFGMIAEAYGDVESARDYYTRIGRPKGALIPSSSLYAMSQQRLRLMGTFLIF